MPIFSGFMLARDGFARFAWHVPVSSVNSWYFLAYSRVAVACGNRGDGLVLTAVYVLRAVMLMTFGKNDGLIEKENWDLRGWEFLPALVLLGLIISVGVYPNLLGGPLQGTIEAMMLALGGR